MATSGRPKRAAAAKRAVIIISDGEEDDEDVKPKKLNNNVINLDDTFSLSNDEASPLKKKRYCNGRYHFRLSSR